MAGKLVGVAEIAEILGVSRQRADQLTRSKGWPEPLERVAPLDAITVEKMRDLFEVMPTVTFAQALEALDTRAYELPSQPRLWRLEVIEQWAVANGRQLPGADPAEIKAT